MFFSILKEGSSGYIYFLERLKSTENGLEKFWFEDLDHLQSMTKTFDDPRYFGLRYEKWQFEGFKIENNTSFLKTFLKNLAILKLLKKF